MIAGEFDEWGYPYVRCRLVIPRLMTETEVRFLIDTGSNITLLHPPDSRQARIQSELLAEQSGTGGIGGSIVRLGDDLADHPLPVPDRRADCYRLVGRAVTDRAVRAGTGEGPSSAKVPHPAGSGDPGHRRRFGRAWVRSGRVAAPSVGVLRYGRSDNRDIGLGQKSGGDLEAASFDQGFTRLPQ